MMHYKRRLIPVNLLDIPAVETWLADLAEKGLFLVSSGNYFAKFAGSNRKPVFTCRP